MTNSELGTMALTCASVDDVTAWCLLAFVVGVVQAKANSVLLVVLLTLGFVTLMFFVLRPVVARILKASADQAPGPIGGTLLAARSTGSTWRQSVGLGVLMNTRGLMELIALNVGLELGVISLKLFAMLVHMALATTIATTPILQWVTGPALSETPIRAYSTSERH